MFQDMAEADTVSNTSSTTAAEIPGLAELGDVPVTSEGAGGLEEDTDSELQAAADRLDTVLTLEPDADINTALSTQDSDSVGAASTSSSGQRDQHDHPDSHSGDSDDASASTGASEHSHDVTLNNGCLLYTSPSPRDINSSRMPSSA